MGATYGGVYDCPLSVKYKSPASNTTNSAFVESRMGDSRLLDSTVIKGDAYMLSAFLMDSKKRNLIWANALTGKVKRIRTSPSGHYYYDVSSTDQGFLFVASTTGIQRWSSDLETMTHEFGILHHPNFDGLDLDDWGSFGFPSLPESVCAQPDGFVYSTYSRDYVAKHTWDGDLVWLTRAEGLDKSSNVRIQGGYGPLQVDEDRVYICTSGYKSPSRPGDGNPQYIAYSLSLVDGHKTGRMEYDDSDGPVSSGSQRGHFVQVSGNLLYVWEARNHVLCIYNKYYGGRHPAQRQPYPPILFYPYGMLATGGGLLIGGVDNTIHGRSNQPNIMEYRSGSFSTYSVWFDAGDGSPESIFPPEGYTGAVQYMCEIDPQALGGVIATNRFNLTPGAIVGDHPNAIHSNTTAFFPNKKSPERGVKHRDSIWQGQYNIGGVPTRVGNVTSVPYTT